jgi:hypothetical protein
MRAVTVRRSGSVNRNSRGIFPNGWAISPRLEYLDLMQEL